VSGTLAVEESDETLMLQVGAGNRDAASELIKRHLGPIVAFAGRTLGDRTEAEDVAQEVFLRLWTHAGRWRSGHLPTWLYRVALNLCLDRIARRRTRPLDEAPEPVDPKPSVAAVLQQQDIGRYVNAELMKLPAQQRIAITLCHYQGLRNAEAADTMGVSVEALESLLARGRRTLRARLRDAVPELLGDG
jgi:RNA polymerase sigma-70 factor (ECF subfamily)